MESVIAVLPAHVIDQIAAGEVIERPASVVKELVDNAIDAGARTISVETAGGGRSLVRVADDGCGMSPGDAVLAFERHATSKLRAVDDLWGIASMGFRGEALPAIASVSRLVLTTRRAQDLAATRVTIEAGRLVSVTDAGAPVGTTVEVTDLLANLPARLKFLKGEATEASHVTDFVAKVAMAHPHLHLRLRHNGRTALDLPPERDGAARAKALLGARVASRMVAAHGEEAGIRVTAYLAAPELAQTTARGVQIFVGRRPIRDRGVLHAVAMGYGELVPRGRYPVAVVLLDVPAGAVDINVHPQKLEVRFADAAAVAAAVRHVVQAGVASAPWRGESGAMAVQTFASVAPPALPFDRGATPLAERYARDLASSRQHSLAFDRGAPSFDRTSATYDADRTTRTLASRAASPPTPAAYRIDRTTDRPTDDATLSPRAWVAQVQQHVRAARDADEDAARDVEVGGMRDGGATRDADGGAMRDDERPDDAEAGSRLAEGSGPTRAQVAAQTGGGDAAVRGALRSDGLAREADARAGYFAGLRYLGQLDLTYLVCEAEGELVLVDQHAAHERVELARLMMRHGERAIAVQRMLFPVTIEATPAQIDLLGDVAHVLEHAGYEAEAFGKTTIAIKAVPGGIRHGEPAHLLRRLLDEWSRDGTPEPDELVARILAEVACHSVVRAGDRLTPGEAEALLRGLDDVDPSTPTPHARALLLRLPLSELGRRFGR